MNLRCGLIFFFLIAARVAMSQSFSPGYIQLKGGEKLQVLIGNVIPGKPDIIQYTPSAAAQIQQFRANEIEGYGIDDLVFTSFHASEDPNDWAFVELLAEGELTLIRRNSLYFLIKRGTKETIHLDRHFRKDLRTAMRDCPQISGRSAKTRMTRDGLVEIVRSYNECIENKRPNRDGMPRAVSFAVLAGIDNSVINFSYANDISRYLSGKPRDKSLFQVGVDLTFRNYKISNHLGLFAGAFHNSNSYGGIQKIVYGNRTEIHDYTLEYNETKIPVGIEFKPPTARKMSFHLRGGMVFRQISNLKATHPTFKVQQSNGPLVDEQPAQLQWFKPKPQVTSSFGFDYRVNQKSRIRLQLGISAGKVRAMISNAGGPNIVAGNYTSYNVLVGYIF